MTGFSYFQEAVFVLRRGVCACIHAVKGKQSWTLVKVVQTFYSVTTDSRGTG